MKWWKMGSYPSRHHRGLRYLICLMLELAWQWMVWVFVMLPIVMLSIVVWLQKSYQLLWKVLLCQPNGGRQSRDSHIKRGYTHHWQKTLRTPQLGWLNGTMTTVGPPTASRWWTKFLGTYPISLAQIVYSSGFSFGKSMLLCTMFL